MGFQGYCGQGASLRGWEDRLFLLWGRVNRRAPVGHRQLLSHQSPGYSEVKDEAVQFWSVEYFFSSWPKDRTNFSILENPTHVQCSTANTTQGQVSMRERPASTAGVMPQRILSPFFAALWQTCFSITSSSFTLTGTQQRKKGRSIAPAVLSRTEKKTAQVCRTLVS